MPSEHDEQLAAAALERRPHHRQEDQRAEARPGADTVAQERDRRRGRRCSPAVADRAALLVAERWRAVRPAAPRRIIEDAAAA